VDPLKKQSSPGRIFAVGDIHGHLTKLEALLERLDPDPEADELIFVGDYVDRGPDSRGVIERLIDLAQGELQTSFLRGNHEQMLLDYVLAGINRELYLFNGGLTTLRGYSQPGQNPLSARPPAEHLAFLTGLSLFVHRPGTIFVHAGLRPGKGLEEQEERDLLWIREEFFGIDYDWPERVVFGHTPFAEPFRKGPLFGLDTGAAYGGPLTCLVLPEEEYIQV
jgi:serine/threonine protein phosphatase 1